MCMHAYVQTHRTRHVEWVTGFLASFLQEHVGNFWGRPGTELFEAQQYFKGEHKLKGVTTLSPLSLKPVFKQLFA